MHPPRDVPRRICVDTEGVPLKLVSCSILCLLRSRGGCIVGLGAFSNSRLVCVAFINLLGGTGLKSYGQTKRNSSETDFLIVASHAL